MLMSAVVLFISAENAAATEYVIHPGGKNEVVFISKATMESFEGKTDRIEGTVTVAEGEMGDSVTVSVTVDLASLDTGIGKRNTHMRNNHLETDKYPEATFSGVTIVSPAGAKLATNATTTLEIEGTLDLHGKSRRTRVTVDVTPTAQGLMIKAGFNVSLADHDISRPKFLFLRLSDVQEVRVEALAVPAP